MSKMKKIPKIDHRKLLIAYIVLRDVANTVLKRELSRYVWERPLLSAEQLESIIQMSKAGIERDSINGK